jgi:hypothetical protein
MDNFHKALFLVYISNYLYKIDIGLKRSFTPIFKQNFKSFMGLQKVIPMKLFETFFIDSQKL